MTKITHNLTNSWNKDTRFIEDHLNQLINWVKDNCQYDVKCYGVPYDNNIVEFHFEDEDEATLFALKWSGKPCT